MNRINELKPNEIFVFGSNLKGVHGAGAARDARQLFGAEMGCASGRTGSCYAIPTKDKDIRTTLPLDRIKVYVDEFLKYAEARPGLTFLVTPIGTGLAGLDAFDIAPMFAGRTENVILPDEFQAWLMLP